MDSVAATCRWIAAVRAQESERVDRLFSDPFAATLAGEEGFTFLHRMLEASPEGPRATNVAYLVHRTRFLDDFLTRTVSETPIRQLVMLASGMDTRAYRMEWPRDMSVYEIDLPEVTQLKSQLLAELGSRPTCRLVSLTQDLRRNWMEPLLESGFDIEQPSVWLVEGLLMYLEESAVRAILRDLSALAVPGSRLGTDMINADFLTHPSAQRLHTYLEGINAPWRFGVNEPESFFAEFGWRADVVQPGELGYREWPLPIFPRNKPGMPRTFFVTGERFAS